MSAYIEKLARAAYEADRPIADAMGLSHDWDADTLRQEAYRFTVRAILSAMLEPSEGMKCAGVNAPIDHPEGDAACDWIDSPTEITQLGAYARNQLPLTQTWKPDVCGAIFQAMLQAALDET